MCCVDWHKAGVSLLVHDSLYGIIVLEEDRVNLLLLAHHFYRPTAELARDVIPV